MMIKNTFSMLDIDVYFEKLGNGLDVYVIPNNKVHAKIGYFLTKYGSKDFEFIPIGKTNMQTYSSGIAHFLEHKVFEQSDGIDPFKFYSERGAECNAYTNSYVTTYYFNGINNFDDNLNYLLDFVQSIHLTNENVEKEKGIIIEEAKGIFDNLNIVTYYTINEMIYHNNPVRKKTIGEIEEIKKITKDELEQCYNTFYHPSNMAVIVGGNVEPEKVIETIKNNQNHKTFSKPSVIVRKKYEEPCTMYMNEKTITWKTSTPITNIIYKIKMPSDFSKDDCQDFLGGIYDELFSNFSGFPEKLKNMGIAPSGITASSYFDEEYAGFVIRCKSDKIEEFIEEVKKHVTNFKPSKDNFELMKKKTLASLVSDSDYIMPVISFINGNIIHERKVDYNIYSKIKNMKYEDYNDFINKINFDEIGILKIMPEDTNS